MFSLWFVWTYGRLELKWQMHFFLFVVNCNCKENDFIFFLHIYLFFLSFSFQVSNLALFDHLRVWEEIFLEIFYSYVARLKGKVRTPLDLIDYITIRRKLRIIIHFHLTCLFSYCLLQKWNFVCLYISFLITIFFVIFKTLIS